MDNGNLDLILTAVSITGTILAVVLAAFGLLYRELRCLDAKVDGQSDNITAVRVSVARIEGYLGIGIPETADERRDIISEEPAVRPRAEAAERG